MNNLGRNLILWIIIGLFLTAVFHMFQGEKEPSHNKNLIFSEFLSDIEQGNVKDVVIKGDVVNGRLSDGRSFSTIVPNYPQLVEKLTEKGVAISVAPAEEGGSTFFQILISWFPMLLLIGVWIFFLRQMQSGNNRALGFGKSRARLLNEKAGRVMFSNVAGCQEAKEEVSEIVEYLKDPQKFQKLGGKIPKGVLLVGSPGTGKTLLARAIAGEANVPFFSISGSDFVEMFVGVGASRVRDLFEQGKKNAPCIIFIDEIDAVGRHRGAGLGGGNDEREQTLNQLLVEMDGFESNEGVILIAATNRPDVLDPALMRPGRFDRQVIVPLPDIIGREEVLKVHMAKVPLASDVDAKVLARGTPGFSGADLANLVNEAALNAARQNKRAVTMSDFEHAKDKVMMGPERRSMVMTDEEKKLTAYHEAGHAIVALHTIDSDPIHKATIIPRGRALGMVVRLPENDRVSMSRAKLLADLAVAMGGRIAEELIFGAEKITTGASSDIRHATEIARRMVTEWGMSDAMGPLSYGEPTQEVFLGHSVTQHKNVSDSTATQIDKEIRKIVENSYDRARQILSNNLHQLHGLAKGLLEYETLSGDEISALLKGEKIEKTTSTSPDKPKKPRSSTPTRKPTLSPEPSA
ncbi:cell division protein FtsH [Candidatus Paracaedimonas acanthamoebae]|nr:cell division protein FtsH [Candidatus Paracaedimonas acanthamoebae]